MLTFIPNAWSLMETGCQLARAGDWFAARAEFYNASYCHEFIPLATSRTADDLTAILAIERAARALHDAARQTQITLYRYASPTTTADVSIARVTKGGVIYG